MSTYATSEAALLALIHAAPSGLFDTANCTRGDFGALDAKGADVACVLMQAGRSECGRNLDGNSHGKRQQRHQIGVTVFAKRKQGAGGDSAPYLLLTETVDALCAWLDTYPRLNGASGVLRAGVTELGDVRFREGRPWIWQTLLVSVLTETEPVLVETARR